jgi:hypothetical protein
MIQRSPLPPGIRERLRTLGRAVEQCPRVLVACVVGGAGAEVLQPLSEVKVAGHVAERGPP